MVDGATCKAHRGQGDAKDSGKVIGRALSEMADKAKLLTPKSKEPLDQS